MTFCFKFPQALAVHEANSCTWVCPRQSPSLSFWIVCIDGCFSRTFHFRTCPAHILSGKPEETWSKGRIPGKLWKQTWQHEWTPSPSVRSRACKRARSWHCSLFYCHLAKQEIFVQRTSCGLRASQPTCAKIKPFAMCSSAKQVKHSTCIGRSPAHGAEPAWKWFTRNWSRRLYHAAYPTPHICTTARWDGPTHARSKYEPRETTWKVSWRAELEAVPRMNLQGLGAMLESLSAKTTTSRWEELTQKTFEKRCRNQSQALPKASTEGAIFSDTIVKTMPYLVKLMVFAIKNGCCFEQTHPLFVMAASKDGAPAINLLTALDWLAEILTAW